MKYIQLVECIKILIYISWHEVPAIVLQFNVKPHTHKFGPKKQKGDNINDIKSHWFKLNFRHYETVRNSL